MHFYFNFHPFFSVMYLVMHGFCFLLNASLCSFSISNSLSILFVFSVLLIFMHSFKFLYFLFILWVLYSCVFLSPYAPFIIMSPYVFLCLNMSSYATMFLLIHLFCSFILFLVFSFFNAFFVLHFVFVF